MRFVACNLFVCHLLLNGLNFLFVGVTRALSIRDLCVANTCPARGGAGTIESSLRPSEPLPLRSKWIKLDGVAHRTISRYGRYPRHVSGSAPGLRAEADGSARPRGGAYSRARARTRSKRDTARARPPGLSGDRRWFGQLQGRSVGHGCFHRMTRGRFACSRLIT